MTTATPIWPRKTRELHNHHFDSTIWNDFAFRDDDIVIGTYAKSGTTWTQQIVGQLIFQGAEDIDVRGDVALARPAGAAEGGEAAGGRGADPPALPQDPPAGGRARVLAARRSTSTSPATAATWSGACTTTTPTPTPPGTRRSTTRPACVGAPIAPPPATIRQYFHDWLDRDGHPFWSFWENIASWWSDPPPAERAAGALRRPQGRHARPDPAHRRLPRHRRRRGPLAGDPRALQLRLHEAPTPPRRRRSAASSGTAAPRPSSTRAPTAAGATC